jgi:hypothetical protein
MNTPCVPSTQTILLCVSLLVLNISILKLLQITLKSINLKDALREKAIPQVPPDAGAGTGGVGEAGGNANAVANTSYSRLTGLFGGVVIVGMVWSLGNVIVYYALFSPDKLPSITSGLGTYLFGSASLFIPYGANQIANAFKS